MKQDDELSCTVVVGANGEENDSDSYKNQMQLLKTKFLGVMPQGNPRSRLQIEKCDEDYITDQSSQVIEELKEDFDGILLDIPVPDIMRQINEPADKQVPNFYPYAP